MGPGGKFLIASLFKNFLHIKITNKVSKSISHISTVHCFAIQTALSDIVQDFLLPAYVSVKLVNNRFEIPLLETKNT